jgi:hypothetical protein
MTEGLQEGERLLARVDDYLERGRILLRWWSERGPSGPFARRFELGRTFNEPDPSFGFFDQVSVNGHLLPIMGNYQSMFYDQPKAPPVDRGSALWMRDQIREFVLRYFMRVSDFRLPEAYVDESRPAVPALLRPVSWCPQDGAARQGFGFRQLFYKRRDTGEIGAFSAAERFAIVDLRTIGSLYEWIVAQVEIFDFSFSFRPLGPNGPQLVLPLQEASYLVLARDFLVHEDDPGPGTLGRYGLGYAFIRNPEQGFLAYGPGKFDAAVELIQFRVGESGATHVDMTFVANRPERIVNLPVDPLQAYVGMMSLVTGGAAAESLCISREQLERDFLVKHFIQHYQALAGSLATWRRVGDWLDASALPEWIRTGRSA